MMCHPRYSDRDIEERSGSVISFMLCYISITVYSVERKPDVWCECCVASVAVGKQKLDIWNKNN